jgi:hypothetical protein
VPLDEKKKLEVRRQFFLEQNKPTEQAIKFRIKEMRDMGFSEREIQIGSEIGREFLTQIFARAAQHNEERALGIAFAAVRRMMNEFIDHLLPTHNAIVESYRQDDRLKGKKGKK